MPVGGAGRRLSIVGRESELAELSAFLEEEVWARALVLAGAPGIGKTTLWEAGVDAARERGLRVLRARPSGATAQRSYAALADLLDEVDLEALDGLPAPQRRALQIALFRAAPTGDGEPRAIAVGFLNVLRALGADEALVVAIDDTQWLDPASADALAFAMHRLESETVAMLLARRPGRISAVERAFERRTLERLDVGPLSLGATRRMLSDRLRLSLPRRVLGHVFDSAGGNPLFALELGRTVAERGTPEIGEPMPFPDGLEDLFGMRVERLPAPVRRLLLAVALSGDLRTSQLVAIADLAIVDDAVDAEVVRVDRDRVLPAHPLLAAAARRHSPARDRRALHLELASALPDEELRALHLALATTRPDPVLGARVAAAAASTFARGAVARAVELAEHALRLTPPEDAERGERVLTLAEYLVVAGEPQRVSDLLSHELDGLPRGPARGRAYLVLADSADPADADEYMNHLERALAESDGDPAVGATALAAKADTTAVAFVTRIADTEAWALEALRMARDANAGSDPERPALHSLAWSRVLRGCPVDDLRERFAAASDDAYHLYRSVERVAAVRQAWRGEVEEARAAFERLFRLADERGEEWSYVVMRLHLCELELRTGEWDAVSRRLDDWDRAIDGTLLIMPVNERCRALLAAGRGLPDEAERWAAEAIAGAEATGVRWDGLEALRARGIAALLAHEPERAVGSLGAVWEQTRDEGVDEPGAFPVAADLVEALVELDELDEARAVTDRLKQLAEAQDHPWGLVTANRCNALVQLASDGREDAAVALARAADDYRALRLQSDCVRSLLAMGRAQRRLKRWGAARAALEQALAGFDELGSPGWAELARSELARVGGRRSASAGELTVTERRVVELAAAGLANKEIARTLFVTVHTVEVHLSNAYRKLGVRSRAQLAGRLGQT